MGFIFTGAIKKGLAGPFGSLAVPSFRWWFISQVLSSSGLFTQNVAAAWLILKQTGNGLDLAFLTCAAFIPVFLAGSWGGQLADRFDHRKLLIITQTSLLALSALLAALAFAGHAGLVSILIISAITGAVNAVDNPARQVYAMDLVGRELLVSAVSLFEVVLNASRVLGPAIGGIILVTAGPAPCFAVNAVSFVAPIVVLLRYQPLLNTGPDTGPDRPQPRPRSRGAVREGLRYVRSVPEIRACVAIAAASGLIFNGTVFYPLLATRAFHLNGGGYGALVAAFGLGALPGALLAARSKEQPSGRVVLVLVAATTASMAVTALAPDLVIGFAGLFLSGFTSIWYIATANTLVQLRADARLRGRVMGVWVMALPGLSPLSSVLAATLANAAGVRFAYLTAGLVILAAALSGGRALWPISTGVAVEREGMTQPVRS
jgi:MFS family permease